MTASAARARARVAAIARRKRRRPVDGILASPGQSGSYVAREAQGQSTSIAGAPSGLFISLQDFPGSQPQSRAVASLAPSAIASNFAQVTVGWIVGRERV